MAQTQEGSDQAVVQSVFDNTSAIDFSCLAPEDMSRGFTQLASLQNSDVPNAFTSSDNLFKDLFGGNNKDIQLMSSRPGDDPNTTPGLTNIQRRPVQLQPGNIGRNIYGTEPIHTPGESNDTEHFGPRRHEPSPPKYRIV